MTFMDNLEKQIKSEKQLTENGAVGYRTSGKYLLDLNFAAGSMRNWSEKKIMKYFMNAFYENRKLAVRWLFYLRDIRGYGMGERRTFRICMNWLCEQHFEESCQLIGLIPEYGRYDDWFSLLDTPAKDTVVMLIRQQLYRDIEYMEAGLPISLLAKWMPSCNTSSARTRHMAGEIRKALELSEREYRQILSRLRAYLQVVEVQMSAGKWSEIVYSKVASRANLVYRKAFLKHDEGRRIQYLMKLKQGGGKIHADTLFPSDIVAGYESSGYRDYWNTVKAQDDTLEELWKALPDYVQGDSSTLVVRDGSGSMRITVGKTKVQALHVSTALAVYFAERCQGQFANRFITFSSEPRLIDMSNAESLRDKLELCYTCCDCMNTNIEAVFDLILSTAVENDMPQKELPGNILIVSDMEFDRAVTFYEDGCTMFDSVGLFERIKEKYSRHGYRMPRLIFWNICSRTNTVPLQVNEAGIALVSGFNPAVYNMVLSGELDPYDCLVKQLETERYDAVEEAFRCA